MKDMKDNIHHKVKLYSMLKGAIDEMGPEIFASAWNAVKPVIDFEVEASLFEREQNQSNKKDDSTQAEQRIEKWADDSLYGRVQVKKEDNKKTSANKNLIDSGLYPHDPDILEKVGNDLESHPSVELYNETGSIENNGLSNPYKKVLRNPSAPSNFNKVENHNNPWYDAVTVSPGETNYDDDSRVL